MHYISQLALCEARVMLQRTYSLFHILKVQQYETKLKQLVYPRVKIIATVPICSPCVWYELDWKILWQTFNFY